MPATERVLLLTPRFPVAGSADRSGLTAYARNAAAGLREAGATVEILAFAEPDRSLARRTEVDGVVVHRAHLGWVRFASRIAPNLVTGHRLLGEVRRTMAGRPFLAVEVPNIEGIGWAIARAVPNGWLRMHTPHWEGFATGAPPSQHHDRFVRRLDRYTARRMAHLITHSEAHAAAMRRECQLEDRLIHVVPHGVPDPGLRAEGAVAPGRILAIGPLHPRKGTDLLLKAFGRVAHLNQRATLVLVGRIDDARVAEQLDRLRHASPAMAARIETPGQLPEADLEAEWARAALVVAASRYESFGLVPVEAMARGVPVISSDIPSLAEIGGGATTLFHTGDASDLAEAMMLVLDSSSRRNSMSVAGRARFESLYTLRRMAEQMLRTFIHGRTSVGTGLGHQQLTGRLGAGTGHRPKQ